LLFERAMSGSYKHMQLFLAYKFGRPSQSVDLTTKGGPISLHEVVFMDFSESDSSFLQHRIGDKRLLRLITKWLKVGVMNGHHGEHNHVGAPRCHE